MDQKINSHCFQIPGYHWFGFYLKKEILVFSACFIILLVNELFFERHLTIILLSLRSNPFYEPKSTPPPNNLVNPVQELETERRVKRKAPAPPVLSPKTGVVNENTVSAGKDLSTSPKVGFYS